MAAIRTHSCFRLLVLHRNHGAEGVSRVCELILDMQMRNEECKSGSIFVVSNWPWIRGPSQVSNSSSEDEKKINKVRSTPYSVELDKTPGLGEINPGY